MRSGAKNLAGVLFTGFFLAILLTGCITTQTPRERYAMVIKVKKDKLEHYKELHANPWKGVMKQLDRCHVRNYSIWLAELQPDAYYLFGYLEYDGDDFGKDMAKMGEDAETVRWWKETDPCQEPIDTAKKGESWVMMQEVFYHDKDVEGTPLMPMPKRLDDSVGKGK
jgi:L-rhamnose mutarotase